MHCPKLQCPPEEERGDVVDLPLCAPLAAELVDAVEDVLAELAVLEGVLLELRVPVPDHRKQLQDRLTDIQVPVIKIGILVLYYYYYCWN